MARATLTYLIARFFYFIPLVYIYKNSGTLDQILFWNTTSAAIGFLALWIFVRRHQKVGLSWDFSYWKKVFRIAWPLSLGVVLNLVYFKADTLILSAYHSAEKVGLYGAAYKVLEVLTTFPHMFMSLILPLFVLAWNKKDFMELKKIQQSTFDFFSIINIWLILVIWLMSEKIMLLVTGAEFVKSAPILNILVLAVVAIFFGTMFTYLVVAIGAQKKMLKYYLMAAIMGLALYFIFIPKYYYWAASIITVVVEVFVWLAAFFVVKKSANISLKNGVILRAIAAALICAALLWPFRNLPVIIFGLLVSLVYFLLLFVMGGIKKEELKLLLNK
jgi:O-antigen/teichoic acid export membrane protein